jgi:hypothetical protein
MICPNLTNSTIRKQFNNLVDVVGEDFAYYLWDKNNGLPLSQQTTGKGATESVSANPLYANLEGLYEGDSRKATLAVAITFGTNFQKKYAGFNKMSVNDQVKSITDYIFNSDKSLEEVATGYIRRANQMNVQKGRAISVNQDQVSREDLRKDPNSVVNKIEDVTGLDKLEAYNNFKNNPISRFTSFANMHNVVNSGAYATWTKHALTLYKGSDYTDIYHESWHEFSQKYLTPAERAALYQTITSREGSFKIGEMSIPYNVLTQRQAEEVLAEEYRAFALKKGKDVTHVAKVEGPIAKFFNRVYNFLQALFNGVTKRGNLSSEELSKSKVTEVFENLYLGKIYTYRRSEKNIAETILNRTKSFTLVTEDERGKHTMDYAANDGFEILNFIDYSLYSKMKADGRKISDLLNDTIRNQYVPELYNAVRENFRQAIAEYEAQVLVAESKKDQGSVDILLDRIAKLKPIVYNDETWMDTVAHHQSFVQGDLFKVDSTVATKDDTQESAQEDTIPGEEGKDVGQYADRSAVNPLQYYDPYVVELIRSLPNKQVVAGQVIVVTGDSLGLPTNGDFLYNKNLLQDKLSGVDNYEEAIKIIEGLVEYNPQMRDLLDMLPSPKENELTPEELLLKGQFLQSMSMPQITPFRLKAEKVARIIETSKGNKEVSGLGFNTFFVSTLTQDALLEFFDNEFQQSALRDHRSENQEEGRKFTKISPNGLEFATFSIESALTSYKLSPQSSTKELFDFMRDAFGIDLYPQNMASFFDKQGNIRQTLSPYSATTEDAMRKSALAAYNKMVLYNLISKLPIKEYRNLHNKVNKAVETPARTFLSDVRKDIAGLLQEGIKELKGDLTPYEEDTQSILSYKEVLNHFNENIGNQTLTNERQLLFKAAENFYYVTKSASFINDEGNLEWSIREWQHLVSEVSNVNNVQNVKDLSGHLNLNSNDFVGNFDETGSFSTNSALLNKLFNQSGTRRKNLSKEFRKMEVVNFTGYTVGPEGKKTINLNPEDKLIQDLGAYLKEGVFENMRPGSKASSYATRMSGSRAERLYYDINTFGLDVENGTVIFPSEVFSQYYKYLNFELSRAYTDTNRKEKLTAKEKRGGQFIIFNGIVPKNLETQMLDIVKNSELSKKEAVAEALKVLPFAQFRSYLEPFLNNEVQTLKAELAEAINLGQLEKNPKDSSTMSLNDRFKTLFPDTANLDLVLADYIANYSTHQIEYMHLFVGDPSNFNIKNDDLKQDNWREVFKRLGASISPGRQPRIDTQDLNTFNNNKSLSRGLESLVSPNTVRDYGTTFNYVQFKDIKTFETPEQRSAYARQIITNYATYLSTQDKGKLSMDKYIAKAEDLLGDNIAAVLDQEKESDAQAYVNLDFMRFYLHSIGEWGPKLEKAYKHEIKVMEKILAYRQTNDPVIYQEIKDLIAQTDMGILTSLKLGYWGSPTNNTNYVTLGKYSVFPMSPSVVFETDLEERALDMFTSGVDFATFDSGSKMSLPVDSIDFYKKETVVDAYGVEKEVRAINPITKESIVEFPIEGLRRQQYIAPKYKNEATLSTQMVKILFSNFYEDGQLSSQYLENPIIGEKIERARQAFINNLNVVVEAEKAKIYTKIGAEMKNGKLVSFDTEMFADWITNEFDKKDIPQAVYDYLLVENNRFVFSLDVAPQRALFESVLASALSKRVVRPKMFGEAYIQLASSGFNKTNTRYTNPTDAEVEKYGVSGLRDYGRVVNGKHQPADIKLAYNPIKHAPLLKLNWNGEQIGTVDRLNKALLDDVWVEQNSQKITIVGVRIPVQALNSMEYLRVREFLPEKAGPIIIVPPSIVTKSGSDFDIDKLFMYEPELDDDGNLILSNKDFQKNPASVYEFIKFRQESKAELAKAINVLKNKKKEFIDRFSADTTIQDVMSSFIANNNMVFKVSAKSKKTDKEESTIMNNALTQAIVLEQALAAQSQDPEIIELTKTISNLKNIYQKYEKYSPGRVKSGSSNEVIAAISDVLSEPSIIDTFLKPTDSPILKGIANYYDNKYRMGIGKIKSSRMFSPSVSLQIFRENATGKKSLGIDAKTNALHKLYQQVGLRYTDEFFLENFRMRSNKDANGIVLGGLYEANNPYREGADKYLISDIINEFINGHVDIEKEDWINYFNADKARTASILQMVLNGMPIEDAILLVNQPIIHHYLKNKNLNQTSRQLGFVGKNVGIYLIEGLTATGLKNYVKYDNGRFSLRKTVREMISDDLFNKHLTSFNEENYTPTTDTSRNSYDLLLSTINEGDNRVKVIAQLAFLTQYALIQEQNENLLNLTSVIDFNTASYRNLNDFHKVAPALREASNYFNKEALDKIISSSVVSPFNITEDAITMGNQVFDVIGSNEYQEFLNIYLDRYGKFWDADTAVTEVNNLNSAVMHAFIQKFTELSGVDYYQEYGPKSKYLTKGAQGNLASQYNKLFKQFSKYDSNLAAFVRKNLFLKNFRKQDVEGTNKFYIAMQTNERDPVTVDAIQKSFEDGLNYNYSQPIEVNGQTIDLNESVRQFFQDVANATILGQGFLIKFRSIQPYLPVNALESLWGAVEELRDIKSKLFTDQTDFTDEQKEEAKQGRLNFFGFLDQVMKIHAKQAFSSASKSMNRLKYFPDYLRESVAKGIVLTPKAKGIAAMLVPNTTDTKLKSKFPVKFEGKEYKDALAAFDANKVPFIIEGKRENASILSELMTSILTERFRQYPRMFGLVSDLGGVALLEMSIFKGMGYEWRTSTTSPGNYLKSLMSAYNNVEAELTPIWEAMQAEKEQAMTEDEMPDTLLDDQAYLDYLNKAGGEEFSGPFIAIEDDGSMDLEDTGLKLKTPPATVQEPMYPTGMVDSAKNEVNLKFSEVTAARLRELLPEASEEKLNFIVAKIQQEMKDQNPGFDFTSTC